MDLYWQVIDSVFDELSEEGCPGEAIDNNWWLLSANGEGSHKLVLQPHPSASLVDVVLDVHDIINGEECVAGAKLHGGDTDWLVIVYVFAEDPDYLPSFLLPHLLKATIASDFVPYNSTVKRSCAAWWGSAGESGAMCWPLL